MFDFGFNTQASRVGALALSLGLTLTAALPGTMQAAERSDDSIPRTASGHPDFSGIWQSLSNADYGIEPGGYRVDAPPRVGIVEDGLIPYQDWALSQREQNFENRFSADPRLSCFSLGTPRGVYYPEPFQILQRDRDISLLFQFSHRARTIHTNGSTHPEGGIGFWFGDSRARWEGDVLVVDVVDFNGETWLDRAGNFHSEALKVSERWQFVDADTIRYQATLEDEQVYTRPWSLSVLLYRHKEEYAQLLEHSCYTLPYDKYYPVPQRSSASDLRASDLRATN